MYTNLRFWFHQVIIFMRQESHQLEDHRLGFHQLEDILQAENSS